MAWPIICFGFGGKRRFFTGFITFPEPAATPFVCGVLKISSLLLKII